MIRLHLSISLCLMLALISPALLPAQEKSSTSDTLLVRGQIPEGLKGLKTSIT